MRSLLTKDIPPRAALVVVVLVLFASIVTGREDPRPAPPPDEDRPATRSQATEAVADIDVAKLKRPQKEEPIADLFAPRSESASSAAPTAPPLPFQYLGKFVDGDKTTVYVIRGGEHYSVEAGQTIEKQYRIDRITDTAVTFTYLPLGTRQVLAVPALMN